ncbi:MAG: amino acid ABC transporter ATP-binding protein [Planctomycetes bacterium]|nr:amino acid ABC transporter ATP-binding protein [Planctomycetota bacterium]
MIKVVNIEKRYNPAAELVLRKLSLEVPAGAFAAILGGSGCGKSTLLRCIVGLEFFERGNIQINETVVTGTLDGDARARDAAMFALRSRVGVVFQSLELFPHLTALDNCTLAPIKVKNRTREQAEALAKKNLADLGLEDKTTAWPEHLSGGQRQRVAIARALTMEPQVLLYDEPTSALDPSLRHEVVETLRRVSKTNVTQIAVTHDLSLARAADIVFIVSEGRVAESGAPQEVLNNPKTEATRKLLAD